MEQSKVEQIDIMPNNNDAILVFYLKYNPEQIITMLQNLLSRREYRRFIELYNILKTQYKFIQVTYNFINDYDYIFINNLTKETSFLINNGVMIFKYFFENSMLSRYNWHDFMKFLYSLN